MRQCALWISPQVGRDEDRIIDTAAQHADLEFQRLRDRDPMPRDTVLVVVHPARVMDLMLEPQPYGDYRDPNHRAMAAEIIWSRCREDADLKKRLRWPTGWVLEIEDPPRPHL